MDGRPESPSQLLDALAAIFPTFPADREPGEVPSTFHEVMRDLAPFLGHHAASSPPDALRRLGDLINAAVGVRDDLENATSTCLLEGLGRGDAWRALRPYLSATAKRRGCNQVLWW